MERRRNHEKDYKMMNKEKAINFLEKHQPMPDDNSPNCTEFLLKEYHRVIVYFTENPCDEAIPLVLNSFGKGDGSGIYTLVDDLLLAANHQIVIDTMCDILKNKNTLLSIRYWVTVFAYDFAEKENNNNLIEALSISKKIVKELLKSEDNKISSASQEIMDFITDWEED